VSLAVSANEGLSKAALGAPDVVVLDLGLPDLDGLEVCHRIRQWSEIPIIVLSATGLEDRKVAALDGGANDYVTKPFGMAELEARIRVALRHARSAEGDAGQLVVGDIEVDLLHHEARYRGGLLELTAKEFDLLAYLARHAGKVCTHQMILGGVWGAEYTREAEYLRVYIYRLRRKLGDTEGRLLRTAPGIGYSLSNDSNDSNDSTDSRDSKDSKDSKDEEDSENVENSKGKPAPVD
jgi:two-component system KDP operon response regulator KdpE